MSIHSCSYYCQRPECIKAQRDELRDRLAQPEQEPVLWRNAAIRVGEELSSVGPDGYYGMTAEQWLDWAMAQEPRGKNSLAQPEQSVAGYCKKIEELIAERDSLRAALAQPEPKPDYWLGYGLQAHTEKPFEGATPIYTSPPQRKPLTEEDCRTGFREQDAKWTFRNMTAWQVWRTACEWNEAAHGIKENT